MSSNSDHRVLGRTGARELTAEEMRWILGSGHNTRASQTPTGTPSHPDENFDS